LARRIEATHIDIGMIALSKGLTMGTDVHRKSKIADLLKVSAWIRKRFGEIDGDIVIEGHYASMVVPKRPVQLVIVLRCDPHELIRRLRKRRMPRKKILENVAAEALDVCLIDSLKSFGRKKICEMDTTQKTLKSVLMETLRVLDGRTKPRFGNVDWLGRLEERGELDALMSFQRPNCGRRS